MCQSQILVFLGSQNVLNIVVSSYFMKVYQLLWCVMQPAGDPFTTQVYFVPR